MAYILVIYFGTFAVPVNGELYADIKGCADAARDTHIFDTQGVNITDQGRNQIAFVCVPTGIEH